MLPWGRRHRLPSRPWLNRRERILLADVIDLHIQGIIDSKQLTAVDPSVESVDTLLELMSSYDSDLQVLQKVRRKLTHAS